MLEKKFTKVYFRVLPAENIVWDNVKIVNDHKTIYIRCLQELGKFKDNVIPTFWTFPAEYVFYNETQEEIYNCVMSDIISKLSQGRDAIILAYGQTGTGKSLTVSGVHNSYHERGILPRIIMDLFQMKRTVIAKENTKICFQLSFIEISRTIIHDLLKPHPNYVNTINEITKIKVKNEDESLKYVFKAEGRKEYAEGSTYPSHLYSSICTFYVNTRDLKIQNQQFRQCKLHVIDLAGADTVGNFSCFFKKPQDIGSANLAKTQLEQFLLVLSANIFQNIKIKYRINPMIQYLGNSLNSSSVLRFIGHIRVSREDLMVTISMLRFGELVGGLKATKYEINIDDKHLDKIEILQNELAKLKSEANYDSVILNENLSTSFNADRFAHVQRTVTDYLQDKVTKLSILSVCEINIALEILKSLCKKYEKQNTINSTTSLIKTKTLSSGNNRILRSKSSRLSNKVSPANNNLTRKTSEEKMRLYSATLNSSRSKIQSVQALGSQTKSKTSGSNLISRSLTSKRNSRLSASKEGLNHESTYFIPMEIQPEYSEAWNMYKIEKRDIYENLIKSYENAETDAKNSYKSYLHEMNQLRQMTMSINRIKNDLLLAQMTRELQNIEKYSDSSSEFEKSYIDQLKKAEKEQMEKREVVMSSQAMLKISLNICKQLKEDLQNSFDLFCKEKYRMPICSGRSDLDETFDLKNITNDIIEEENETNKLLFDHVSIKKYDQLKTLIAVEQRKKKKYLMRQNEWTFY